MKVKLSPRKKISIGLIAIGIVGLVISAAASLSDLMTVYRLVESIDLQDNGEIARQLKDIEIRTQLYNAMMALSILVVVIGMLLLLVKKHSRTYGSHHS